MSEINKTKEIQIVKKQDEISGFIKQAIEKNLPVETMERLFTLHKEVKAEQAKEGFVLALAKFQSKVPIIKKTKKVLNKDGRSVRYMYAPMDSVIEQIKKPLSSSGFSYTWDSSREEVHIKVVCKLTHIEGHSEKSTFDIPIEKSNFMSSPQSYATAQSYAKRYTLLNVLGIGTADEDTDATDSDNDSNVKSKKSQIMFLLKGLGYKVKTKEDVEKATKETAKVKLEEKNFEEIIDKLQILTSERQGL